MFSACQYLLTADIFPQHGVESKWQNRNTPRTNQDFSLRGTRSATTVGAGWFQIQNRLLNHDEETFDRRRRKGIDGSCGKTVALTAAEVSDFIVRLNKLARNLWWTWD